MKIVYVLTSRLDDFYIEQAMVSMYSVKLHNPDSEIIVVADPDTENLIKKFTPRILQYADIIEAVECPAYMTNMQKSRFW